VNLGRGEHFGSFNGHMLWSLKHFRLLAAASLPNFPIENISFPAHSGFSRF
jgi:hypothetical protein